MIRKHSLFVRTVQSTWKLILACVLVAAAAVPRFCAEERDLSRPSEGAGPTQVRVFFYLADLHEIAGADQTFHADVVVEAEWMDPRLAGRWTSVNSVPLVDVWNPRLALVNQK